MSNGQSLRKNRISNGWFVLLFFTIAAILAFSNWPIISTHNTEVGDFAANSLLILDAKHFSLFVGNYSRVGFNHPGPAILYVLALGEFIFFDLIKLVPSPFSGQLLAVALYSSFWIVLILKLLTKITGKLAHATVITSLFITTVTFLDHQFLTGMWFPHLYMLPFAAMVISISTVLNGRIDSLQSLALSSGFLINGHVSFVATLGITLIFVLLFNRVVFKNTPSKLITSINYINTNKTALILSLTTLSLFFIPLLIETALHFPGPIAGYAKFSGGHTSNTLGEAIKYTTIFWGGIALAVASIVALIILNVKHTNTPNNWTRALSLTFLATSLAFLFYAKYGVDMLDQTYIGFFYFAVPSLTLALICFNCLKPLSEKLKTLITPCIIIVCTVLTFQTINKSPAYINDYNQPDIQAAYDKLEKLNYSDRMVLDLDNRVDWGNIWSDILGIELHSARKNKALFCINKNWHISFTPNAKCTPAEVESNRRFYVTRNTNAPDQTNNIAINTSNLVFTETFAPAIAGKGFININENQDIYNKYLLKDGWSVTDQDFAWSTNNIAILSIPTPEDFTGTVTLDLGAFTPHPKVKQNIRIIYNNQVLTTQEFNSTNNRQKIGFNISSKKHNMIYLNIEIQHPISPKELGLSDDPRKLGVALYGMQVEESKSE